MCTSLPPQCPGRKGRQTVNPTHLPLSGCGCSWGSPKAWVGGTELRVISIISISKHLGLWGDAGSLDERGGPAALFQFGGERTQTSHGCPDPSSCLPSPPLPLAQHLMMLSDKECAPACATTGARGQNFLLCLLESAMV